MDIGTFQNRFRDLLREVNPENSDEISLAVIKILTAEARRLSRTVQAAVAPPNRRSALAENSRDVGAAVPASSAPPALENPGPASAAEAANLSDAFQDTPPVPENVTEHVEQELQEVADSINKAHKITVFVGAGISTNCGIPVGSDLSFRSSLNKNLGLPIRSRSS